MAGLLFLLVCGWIIVLISVAGLLFLLVRGWINILISAWLDYYSYKCMAGLLFFLVRD